MIDARPVVLTVTQLNSYVKQVLDNDFTLNCVFMIGEISNFTNHYRTGHLYFTLKDKNSCIRAVMFKSNAERLRFNVEDGMSVIVRGRVSLFEAQGSYQFYVDDMQPDGIGALTLEFEQIKKRLYSEGLFDSSHKKSLPEFPDKIGVITSPTGAAIEDIRNILGRRYPCAEVILYPAQVQGENSVAQLISGLSYFNETASVDVIIIGRGGGSIEDLWSFNSEELAREIYKCQIPVISAVGHETDFTIADFVADVRAETPSAAAEMAVPDNEELKRHIASACFEMKSTVKNMLSSKTEALNSVLSKNSMKDPCNALDIKRMMLDSVETKMINTFNTDLTEKRHLFSSAVEKLNALSPLKILARGYSVAYYGSKAITSSKEIEQGSKIEIDFYDGSAVCEVKELK